MRKALNILRGGAPIAGFPLESMSLSNRIVGNRDMTVTGISTVKKCVLGVRNKVDSDIDTMGCRNIYGILLEILFEDIDRMARDLIGTTVNRAK
jgi:hypothetical protein